MTHQTAFRYVVIAQVKTAMYGAVERIVYQGDSEDAALRIALLWAESGQTMDIRMERPTR